MNSSQKYDNSALGSWAGYIYQGLCGLYHSIKLIGEKRGKYAGYRLYLDSYEDFAIANETDELVSLHQCKDEKWVTDYTEEYNKMHRKLLLFQKSPNVKCIGDCKLYFHTNKNVKTSEDIILYPFTEQQKFCEPDKIIPLITAVVTKIIGKDKDTVDIIVFRLVALIDRKVLSVHQKYIVKSNKESLKNIAKKEYIKFQDIIDILFAEVEVFKNDRDSFIIRIKYELLNRLQSLCDDDDMLKQEERMSLEAKQNIQFLINRICSMNVCEMEKFLQRIHPMDNLSDRNLSKFADVANSDKACNLFRVVTEIEHLEDDLSWNNEKGRETPTSLGNNPKTAIMCKRILDNAKNLDVLYEYDWLIGDVREDVSSIGDYLKSIANVNDRDKAENNIFSMKKVGILTIDSRKNEKYD